jgi:hypothetical protein
MKSARVLLLLTFLAFLFAVVFSGAVLAQPAGPQSALASFARPVLYSAGFGAQGVAVADLNGDGHLDLIVVDAQCYKCVQSQVSVLLGNGDGTFKPAVNYSAGYQGQSVVVGDLNADGHLDVVVANTCQSMPNPDCPDGGAVTVLLGNGDGSLRPSVTYSSGGFNAGSALIGKVAGDTKPDIIVANQCPNAGSCNGLNDGTVGILLGKGDGTFRPAVTYDAGGINPRSIAFFDTNQDGRPDVVVVSEFECPGCNSGFAVLLGNADGTFQQHMIYSLNGVGGPMVVGDVDRDGHPDLIIALCPNYLCNTDTLANVLLGNGDGTFRDIGLYFDTGGVLPHSITLADVTGDGRLDLIVTNQCRPNTDCTRSTGIVNVLVGRDAGNFLSPVTFNTSGYDPLEVVAADINGDQRPDLIVANNCLRYSCNAKTGTGAPGVFLNNYFPATTTTVASSLNPSKVNQAATFTATISSSDVPDGSTVTFYDGAATLGTGKTSGDVATLTTSFSKAGKHMTKASYAGDVFHKASSGTLTQVVNP